MAKTLKKLLVLGVAACLALSIGLVMTACGDPEPETFTVTFDVLGHGTAPDAQEVTDGEQVQKPDDPTAKNWIFGGWFKEEGCTTAYDFAKATITADTTIYAKWTAAPAVPTFENGMKHLYMTDSGETSIENNVWHYINEYKPQNPPIDYHFNVVEIAAGKAVAIMWHLGSDIEVGTTYKVDIRSTVDEDDFAQDKAMREGLDMWIQDPDVAAGQGSSDYYWSEWNRTFGLIGLQIAFTQDQLDNITTNNNAMYKIILKNNTANDVTLRIVCAVGDAH